MSFHWIVERVELEFENMSDQRINWHFNQFYYEYLGSSVTIPLPEEGNKYCLLARETISYEFDVPGLQMQLKPLRVPTTVRFGFSINYDNVPRLKVRTTKRVLDCNIITLAPVEFYVNIVEQDEC